jgi:hypothetical protein
METMSLRWSPLNTMTSVTSNNARIEKKKRNGGRDILKLGSIIGINIYNNTHT